MHVCLNVRVRLCTPRIAYVEVSTIHVRSLRVQYKKKKFTYMNLSISTIVRKMHVIRILLKNSYCENVPGLRNCYVHKRSNFESFVHIVPTHTHAQFSRNFV